MKILFLKRCSACPSEFSDAQHRVAHINVSHPKVMQREAWTACQKCHMRFPRKDVLKDHIKRVHQGGKSKCLICEEVFWTDPLFRQHWKKCVIKWVKSAKNVQENAAVEEQLMNQLGCSSQATATNQDPMDVGSASSKEDPDKKEPDQEASSSTLMKNGSRSNDYLCAFCHFIFSTKAGYMEHTKLGNCIQPTAAHSGKYKYTSPVPCYYCPAHCASRKALQAHVKEAHAVVKPEVKEEESNGTAADGSTNTSGRTTPVKHIYSCRPCNRKFDDLKALEHHQQHEHYECDNCFKFFSFDNLEGKYYRVE